jgi:SagB-type dehydrogenase family enzyme
MYIDFSVLFHQSSKDLVDKGRAYIPKDSDAWPIEWKQIYYKTYPRLSKISLSREPIHADYEDVLKRRHSNRDFTSRSLSKKELSQLLLYSCGLLDTEQNNSRVNPSGGARFPIEVYPIVFSGNNEVPAGVYHYDVKNHSLDVLWSRKFSPEDISKLFVYDFVHTASCALILTGVFSRDQMKYGERGYRYILLDAGHISENVYLTGTALGLKVCALGGSLDENIEQLLDIDGVTESLVHTIIIG